jgi:hypothetical protein
MKESQTILNSTTDFLRFMKTRIPFYHMSNVFFRDLHYGVMAYLEKSGKKMNYVAAETVTREVVAGLEKAGIFRKIDHQSWQLNYPEYALPRVEKTAVPVGA